MFWIGFGSIYLIVGCLFLLMKLANGLFIKIVSKFKKVETAACVFVFTVFSYMSILIYSIVALLTENIMINALICAVFLVFCCFIVEKLNECMAGESKNETNKVLTKEDKNYTKDEVERLKIKVTDFIVSQSTKDIDKYSKKFSRLL